jgi:HD-GYP domain-containing protein (c-di-GMP phosphodiesterase class II)
MRSHPRVGYAIVRDLPLLRAASECVVGHHERHDGRGYPLGVMGKDLTRPARIVAVADALDAMSVLRPYRRALPFERIYEELVTNRGTQFDPEVVDAAVQIFRSYADLHPDARRSRQEAESELFLAPPPAAPERREAA